MKPMFIIVVLSLCVVALQAQAANTTAKHFCFTSAPLLSQHLGDCDSLTASTCVGGLSSARAYQRHMQAQGEPTFVLPLLDHLDPFVLMHPSGADVNKQFFQRFGWNTFAMETNVLTSPDRFGSIRDPALPFVSANTFVQPTNQWIDCRKQIYVDSATGVGFTVLQNVQQAPTLGVDWRASMRAALDQFNRLDPKPTHIVIVDFLSYARGPGNYTYVLSELQQMSNIKIDGYMSADNDNVDGAVNTVINGTHVVTTKTVLYSRGGDTYTNLVCMDWEVDAAGNIANTNRTAHDLLSLPAALNDTQYHSDLAFARGLDHEAVANDPIVGYTTEMSLQTTDATSQCMAGECQLGSLFTDAYKWKLDVDVALMNSGGPRGPGWAAGEVRVSDIFAGMPWQNTMCNATVRGLTLWEMYNASVNSQETISEAFRGNGYLLFQMSGMRAYCNNDLSAVNGRLNGIEVYNRQTGVWEELDRLKLYKVAIPDFECNVLVTSEMNGARYDGEIAATHRNDITVQDVLAEYLTATTTPANPKDVSLKGRYVNLANTVPSASDTFRRDAVMQWTQSQSACPANTFWDEPVATCQACPSGEESAPGSASCEKPDESSIVVYVVVPIAVVIILALVIVLALSQVLAEKRATEHAPKSGEVTILFTDIQDSTKLWGTVPMSMNACLARHHGIIRAAIAKYKAYEVKTVGDAFMIACSTPEAALSVAVEIQRKLQEAPAPPCIAEVYNAEESQLETIDDAPDAKPVHDAAFNGLRVRIGIHTGEPEVKYDEVTLGYDYYGPVVNVAARVEGAGAGGQICCTNEVLKNGWQCLSQIQTSTTSLGLFALKGVTEEVELNQVMPNEMTLRTNLVQKVQARQKLEEDDAEKTSTGSSYNRSEVASTVNNNNTAMADIAQMTSIFFQGLFRPVSPATSKMIREQLLTAWHIPITKTADGAAADVSAEQLCRRVTLAVSKKLLKLDRDRNLKNQEADGVIDMMEGDSHRSFPLLHPTVSNLRSRSSVPSSVAAEDSTPLGEVAAAPHVPRSDCSSEKYLIERQADEVVSV